MTRSKLSDNKALALLSDYLVITVGVALYAFAWAAMMIPNGIASGGLTGNLVKAREYLKSSYVTLKTYAKSLHRHYQQNGVWDTMSATFGTPLARGEEGQMVWILILNIIDDHSRLLIASIALATNNDANTKQSLIRYAQNPSSVPLWTGASSRQ